MLPAILAAVMVPSIPGQTLPSAPPSRPRLVFTAQDIPILQSRVSSGGSIPAWAYAQMSGSASFATGSNQASWQVYRSMRFMVENAVKWRLSGSQYSKSSAINLLIAGSTNAISYLQPTGSNKPYVECTYPAAIGIAFDLLYDELTPTQRSQVVSHLQSWVSAIYSGSAGPGPYSQYGGCTDNQSFAWNTGLVFALLAIWGEPGVNNATLPQDVDAALAHIEDGYRDAVSPDGSYDENSGYAHYGCMYSLRAMRAATLCGFSDRVSGTNIEGMPRWFGRLLMGDSYSWTGDSSPTHRGTKFDPVLYSVVSNLQDGEGFWALERVRAFHNVDINASTFAFSAFLSLVLHYLVALVSESPDVLSAFYRDNLNLAPSGNVGWNKLNNHHALGEGGSAWLHNGSGPGWQEFGVHYIIRDEWMNHSHEDDGHVDIVVGGKHLYIDRGYANPAGYVHAQSTHHNIVTVGGEDFQGAGNNYYQPPSPDGRFHGKRVASLLSPGFDYIHGDHAFMWMMERAERTVVLIKDPVNPITMVMDEVRKSSGSHTYEQRWNTAGPMYGNGTASNPVSVSAGGATARATYLSPSQVTVSAGASASNAGTTYYPNRVLVPGTGNTMILGVWGGAAAQGVGTLTQPSANARGGVVTWSASRVDKVIAPMGAGPVSDAETSGNGAFHWIRMDAAGAVEAWAACEGTELTHGQEDLLVASEPVTVVVKDGEVWMTRALGTPAASALPTVVLTVPGPVTRVNVDGDDVPFMQNGGVLSVGAPPPPPPAPPITDDRFYTFTQGQLLDARVVGSVVTTTDGRVRAEAGTATFRPLEGRPYGNQPLAVALDVEPIWPGIGGSLGSVRFSTPGGDGDILSVELFEAPNSEILAYAYHPVSVPTIAVVPQLAYVGSVRLMIQHDPAAGTLEILDRAGGSVAMGSVPGWLGDVEVSVVMTDTALYDNIGVFDSAEDGVTPSGVAVWIYPDRSFGFAVHTPAASMSAMGLSAAGISLAPSLVISWMVAFQFQELLILNHLVPGGNVPSTLLEYALESMPGAIPNQPGISWVVGGITPAGVTLSGGAWIEP